MANLRFEVVAEAFKKKTCRGRGSQGAPFGVLRQVCIQPPEDVQKVSAI